MTRTGKVFGLFVAAIALVSVVSLSSASESFNLKCSLIVRSGERHDYAFRIEIPRFFGAARVTWVETNTHDLKIVSLDDTRIIADFGTRLSGWPDKAESISFVLNRITGDAEALYLRTPTKDDPQPPSADFKLIMDAFSEKGTCSKSERAF